MSADWWHTHLCEAGSIDCFTSVLGYPVLLDEYGMTARKMLSEFFLVRCAPPHKPCGAKARLQIAHLTPPSIADYFALELRTV